MGLSPGKNKKKVNTQELRAQTAINNVGTVNPLEQRINSRAEKFFNWEDQTAPKDITSAPGMGDYLDIYGNARELANQERFGEGAIALANPADAAYANQIKQQKEFQLYDDRAEGLSNAFQGLKAQNHGIADSAIDRDYRRKATQAGLEQNLLGQFYGRYKIQNPWYQKLWNFAKEGAQMAGQAYGAGA